MEGRACRLTAGKRRRFVPRCKSQTACRLCAGSVSFKSSHPPSRNKEFGCSCDHLCSWRLVRGVIT
eukprot:356347-Chlamydomonas_euryale.AAC.7